MEIFEEKEAYGIIVRRALTVPKLWVSQCGRILGARGHWMRTTKIYRDTVNGRVVSKCVVTYNTPIKKKTISVHQLVAETWINNPYGLPMIDHIDGDCTHNATNNLRWVSARGNALNMHFHRNRTCKSKYPGVTWVKTHNKWKAQIQHEGKRKSIGHFDNEEDAYQALNAFKSIIYI